MKSWACEPDQVADLDHGVQLLEHLAPKGGGVVLAGLDLAAGELPLPGGAGPVRPPRDEQGLSPPHHRGDDADPLHLRSRAYRLLPLEST